MLIGFFCLRLEATTLKVYETHTGLLGDQREYAFELNIFDQGGLQLQGILSLNEWFALGISAVAEGVIGVSDLRFYIPNVFAKVKVTDNPPESWNVAFGYDLLYSGSFYEFDENNLIFGRYYGLFGVFSKGFFLGSSLPHLVNLGVYYPVVPTPAIPHVRLSLLTAWSEVFRFGIELNDITFDRNKTYNFMNNYTAQIQFTEQIALHFIFQIASQKATSNTFFDLEGPYHFGRSIRLVYRNYF